MSHRFSFEGKVAPPPSALPGFRGRRSGEPRGFAGNRWRECGRRKTAARARTRRKLLIGYGGGAGREVHAAVRHSSNFAYCPHNRAVCRRIITNFILLHPLLLGSLRKEEGARIGGTPMRRLIKWEIPPINFDNVGVGFIALLEVKEIAIVVFFRHRNRNHLGCRGTTRPNLSGHISPQTNRFTKLDFHITKK